jgi:glycosyltransferase involved in cell wall biosynthesis
MFLTIITPTYNRVKTLSRLYTSLEKQSQKNFEWLIVDDGSTDTTKSFIDNILIKSTLKIRYIYKNNGGKHTAINEGIKNIHTPLTFIVDSDDYLTRDAVETIYKKWSAYKSDASIGSFWYLQSDSSGNIIGDEFPTKEFISNYTEVMINSGIKGDKKSVYVTQLRKEFPFPEYEDERFIGEGIIHKQIGDRHKSVFINKVIYKCEYLDDGLSRAGKKMRINNPKGGMANSKVFQTKNVALKVRLKKMLLFVTYGLLSDMDYRIIVKTSGNPLLVTICTPVSYLIYLKWRKLLNNKEI